MLHNAVVLYQRTITFSLHSVDQSQEPVAHPYGEGYVVKWDTETWTVKQKHKVKEVQVDISLTPR